MAHWGGCRAKTNKQTNKKDMYVRVVREEGKEHTSHSDKARRFTLLKYTAIMMCIIQ